MPWSLQGQPYPAVSIGLRAIEWIEAHCTHGPGDYIGQPVKLDLEFQRFLVRAYAYRQGRDGLWRRVYGLCIDCMSKGRGKTLLAGCVASLEFLGPARLPRHWDGRGDPNDAAEKVLSPFIRVMATELGQAKSTTYSAIAAMLDHERMAPAWSGHEKDIGKQRILGPDGSEIRPSTSGSASKDGGRETFVVWEELHLYRLPEQWEVYETVMRNLPKRRLADPWAMGATTMYAIGEGSVLEDMDEGGAAEDPRILWDYRSGRELTEEEWQDRSVVEDNLREAYGEVDHVDLERLADDAMAPGLDRGKYARYYFNIPALASARWLAKADVKAAMDPESFPQLVLPKEKEVVCAGFDGSVGTQTGERMPDSTALAACRVPDLLLWEVATLEHPGTKEGDRWTLWTPRRADLLAALEELMDRFTVHRLYMDPYGWEGDAEQWMGRWPTVKFVAWTTVAARSRQWTAAIRTLGLGVAERTQAILPSQTAEDHLTNATRATTTMGQEERYTLKKPTETAKIDTAVALTLAREAAGDCVAEGCKGLPPRKPRIHSMR